MKQDPIEEIKALIVKGDMDQSIQKLSEFLNGDFFNDEALLMLGACFMSKGMNGLGAIVTHAAVAAREERGKGYPEALLNLGDATNQSIAMMWRSGFGKPLSCRRLCLESAPRS